MKKIVKAMFLVAMTVGGASASFASSTENLAAHGYDVVSYFDGQAASGSGQNEVIHDGFRYRFMNEANKARFEAEPASYLPQYGGLCATAMAMDMKLDIDPEKYKVTDGFLYLFSNVNGTDAREMWLKDEAGLKARADKNWWRRVKPKGDKKYHNLTNDVAAHGYDLISYRDGKPTPGQSRFSVQYKGIRYLFVNAKNKGRFLSDPEAYLPEYGGWCATATAMGMTLDIEPLKFKISEGRLFLFSNVNGQDAREMWIKDEANLTVTADKVWERRISQ